MLQVVSDFIDFDDEIGTLRAMAEVSRRPLSISLAQAPRSPRHYRRILDAISESNADGLEVRAQVAARAIGILLGLQGSVNPFARSRDVQRARRPAAARARRPAVAIPT